MDGFIQDDISMLEIGVGLRINYDFIGKFIIIIKMDSMRNRLNTESSSFLPKAKLKML